MRYTKDYKNPKQPRHVSESRIAHSRYNRSRVRDSNTLHSAGSILISIFYFMMIFNFMSEVEVYSVNKVKSCARDTKVRRKKIIASRMTLRKTILARWNTTWLARNSYGVLVKLVVCVTVTGLYVANFDFLLHFSLLLPVLKHNANDVIATQTP